MEGVLHLRQAVIGSRGGRVELGRRLHVEGLVGAFLVELADEAVEAVLLLQGVHAGRARRLGLQGAVHAFVPPVLLRRGRTDPLVLDAEPDPPDAELREPVQSGVGEGHPIVGPDRAREPIRAESALEHRARPGHAHGEQRLDADEKARVLIGDRERVAVDAVARLELPFEVGGPELVRRGGPDRHHAGMDTHAPAPAALHEAAALEEIGNGAHGRPVGQARVARRQILDELGGAPARVRATGVEEECGEGDVDPVRTVVRRMRAIVEAARPLGLVAGEPLVAGLAAHAVARAELGEVVQAAPVVADEVSALLHGMGLLPGHRPPPRGWSCPDAGVLPILPEYCVTNQPGLYRPAT